MENKEILNEKKEAEAVEEAVAEAVEETAAEAIEETAAEQTVVETPVEEAVAEEVVAEEAVAVAEQAPAEESVSEPVIEEPTLTVAPEAEISQEEIIEAGLIARIKEKAKKVNWKNVWDKTTTGILIFLMATPILILIYIFYWFLTK